LSLDQDGYTDEEDTLNTPPAWGVFRRRYTGAFTVQGNGFSVAGDSGSAVVTHTASPGDPDNNKVAGILFAGSSTMSAVTPILPILAAFPALHLTVETATAPGVDKTVPALAAAAMHAPAAPASVDAVLSTRLTQKEQEITATPAGKRYSELIQRHFPEAQTLVNKNRRVATAWHRNGGPQLVRGLLRMAESPQEALPAEIDGKPLPQCLAGIQGAFTRYGSPALAADLSEYGPALALLAGLNYTQALDALRSMRVE